jgi:ABC-type amino acid transport substrate-binding protein
MSIIQWFIVSFLLFGCTESNDRIDTLVVGTAADNPPYEFVQSSTIMGLDIDIANKIGEYLGKRVEIRNMEFSGLMAALSSNKVDMVIAGLSITAERANQVDFSDIYASGGISVVFRKIDNFKDIRDLDGKILGAQLGSTWEKFAQSLSAKYGERVLSLSNNLALIQELLSARLDAVILETHQAEKFTQNNTNLDMFRVDYTDSDFAIALPKGSPIKDQVNQAIKRMKEDGTINGLMVKWIKR